MLFGLKKAFLVQAGLANAGIQLNEEQFPYPTNRPADDLIVGKYAMAQQCRHCHPGWAGSDGLEEMRDGLSFLDNYIRLRNFRPIHTVNYDR